MVMTRTTKILGISVPPPIVKEYEEVARAEHRTKSEMFREVFRFYRTYHKQVERVEEARFQRMVDEVIAETIKAQEEGRSLMTEEAAEKLEQELLRYGEQQAKKVGINIEDDKEINRIMHKVRARRRGRNRTY